MITPEQELSRDALLDVAKKMMLAARTAPKARGVNHMEMCLATGDSIPLLAKKMKEIGEKQGQSFFIRDAENLSGTEVVFLIGSRIRPLNLKVCGMCGFGNCETKDAHPLVPCAFNTGDLGIAIGSAVSVAADHRVDNRIMYTIGQAALELELFDQAIKIIYGIPLSATSKNPFFDRK
jgi:uncharacterized ferredoxin-like protein